MSKTDDVNEQVNAEIDKAKSGFDLRARAAGRGLRRDKIEVYTDEITGDLLGDARKDEIKNPLGMIVDIVVTRIGVIGELAKLDDALDAADTSAEATEDAATKKRRKALEAEKTALLTKLHESSFEIELLALPEIVVEGIERETRSELDIKSGKDIPVEKAINFSQIHTAKMLEKMVVGIKDNKTGDTGLHIDYEDAKALREFVLPRSEYNRLRALVNDIQFKDAFSLAVTSQPDF